MPARERQAGRQGEGGRGGGGRLEGTCCQRRREGGAREGEKEGGGEGGRQGEEEGRGRRRKGGGEGGRREGEKEERRDYGSEPARLWSLSSRSKLGKAGKAWERKGANRHPLRHRCSFLFAMSLENASLRERACRSAALPSDTHEAASQRVQNQRPGAIARGHRPASLRQRLTLFASIIASYRWDNGFVTTTTTTAAKIMTMAVE